MQGSLFEIINFLLIPQVKQGVQAVRGFEKKVALSF